MLDITDPQPAAIAEEWLNRFEKCLSDGSPTGLDDLFLENSYWRDVLALTWNLETSTGKGQFAARLAKTARAAGLTSPALDSDAPPPQWVTRVGREVIEAFFTFETGVGRGRGIVRLAQAPNAPDEHKAWTFLTALEELKGFEEATGRNRPTGQSHSRDFRGPNWLDQRREAEAFRDRDPAVLVVGGGQAGLAIAARLTQLGVDTLIVDRGERIGDNWRKRYHALTLHNQVQVNHLPYMPFPPSWPTYIPKDKLANWFETYVDALELNFWTSTELVHASYDEENGAWSAKLQRDGPPNDRDQPAPHHYGDRR